MLGKIPVFLQAEVSRRSPPFRCRNWGLGKERCCPQTHRRPVSGSGFDAGVLACGTVALGDSPPSPGAPAPEEERPSRVPPPRFKAVWSVLPVASRRLPWRYDKGSDGNRGRCHLSAVSRDAS